MALMSITHDVTGSRESNMAATKPEIFRSQLQLMHISMDECIEHDSPRCSLIINDKNYQSNEQAVISEIRAQTLIYITGNIKHV
jgi:hypothetical protein